MLFNSFAFLVFLPAVYIAYWWVFRRNVRVQNLFVLASSWFFYGWWDVRFLGLLVASSLCDHLLGLAVERSKGTVTGRIWVGVSIAVNLGLLGFFKYFNFFAEGLSDLLSALGFQAHMPTLRVLLPVGISFYTFQSLGYIIDVYRGQVKAQRDPIVLLAFISFFPQLVAGPIERARQMLPQFERPRRFTMDSARDGLRQMLWGFFKKIAIADTCAPLANAIFDADPATTGGITLFFGAFFFAFQIYGDFSGYSDIAIGSARLFGFELGRNFAFPYFSRSIPEFWHRWHISLSTWFRDYVYLPLGGWRTKAGRMRNIMITFLVSGLWHGANWTFVAWGALNGAYYAPQVIGGTKARRDDPVLRDLPRILLTFLLVVVTWIFFRAADLGAAVDHVRYMCTNATWYPGALLLWTFRPESALILILVLAEWRARRDQHAMQRLPARSWLRWALYLAIIVTILLNLDLRTAHAFIYFQF